MSQSRGLSPPLARYSPCLLYTSVRQNQGFTYADLNQYQWKDNGNDHGEYRLYSGLDGNDVEAKTNKAVKVNSGQITTYPFKIADEINIATTHKPVSYTHLDVYKRQVINISLRLSIRGKNTRQLSKTVTTPMMQMTNHTKWI